MKYVSTRGKVKDINISQAMQKGLAQDGGLYVPEYFPQHYWENWSKNLTYSEFATATLSPFFKGDYLENRLSGICREVFNFPVPLKRLNNNLEVLELFHGETLSFKDFGARFLANCLGRIPKEEPLTILVATSGDTGSAVAAAFYAKYNIRVVILFPKDKVSQRQESQITCWGKNILALEVDGDFDKCQKLVKDAFEDSFWKENANLSTSNSINIGRLLPQMTYYAYISWKHFRRTKRKANFIIPSGNLGNSLSCFWAQKCGFPIDKITICQNENNSVVRYLKKSKFEPKETIHTLANAMDVGNPSNFERLKYLYDSYYHLFTKNINAISVSDEQIKKQILDAKIKYNYIVCPHTATAFKGYKAINNKLCDYFIIATADPCKFEKVLEEILKEEIKPKPSLQRLLDRKKNKVSIDGSPEMFKEAYKKFFKIK